MTEASGDQTMFVVGDRTFAVRVDYDQAPRSVTVTVTMDGRFEWTFDEPGWRPLSFGAGLDLPYLWSARELIVLPQSADSEPEVLKVDEDLLFVFSVGTGWLLVCETSVRRIVAGIETARLDLREVVEHAAWDGDRFVVRDSAGAEYQMRVQGDRLIT
jgi:hypothetical protein